MWRTVKIKPRLYIGVLCECLKTDTFNLRYAGK